MPTLGHHAHFKKRKEKKTVLRMGAMGRCSPFPPKPTQNIHNTTQHPHTHSFLMSEKPNHPAQLGSNLGHTQSFPDHPLLPVKSPHTLNQSFHTLPTHTHTNLYKVLHVLGREGQDSAVDSLGWVSETD